MRVIKFIVFICFFVIFIVIANLIHKNMNSYETVNIRSPFTYYNIITYNNNDVRALASISFRTSFDNLSDIFGIDKVFLRNNILRKSINIRDDAAELVVFTQDNAIGQITINTSENVDVFLDNMLKSLEDNNINLEKEVLDRDDGDILAEIYTYTADNYKIVITKSYLESNNYNLSIDYINLNIL